jgi:hypothetical protein
VLLFIGQLAPIFGLAGTCRACSLLPALQCSVQQPLCSELKGDFAHRRTQTFGYALVCLLNTLCGGLVSLPV